jgi:WD40 repeat protein
MTGKHHLTYTGHPWGSVNSVVWSPDGKEIASGSSDTTVQVWDASTGNKHLTYTGHARHVRSVAWSPDGKYIASGGLDTTVQVWEAMTGKHHLTYTGHPWGVNSVVWSPDGRLIASGDDEYIERGDKSDSTVQIWEAMTGKHRLTYIRYTGDVNSVAWSPNGKRIASGGSDERVQVWQAM